VVREREGKSADKNYRHPFLRGQTGFALREAVNPKKIFYKLEASALELQNSVTAVRDFPCI
jgi:hypothetical protein